jgi:hypothetical protein
MSQRKSLKHILINSKKNSLNNNELTTASSYAAEPSNQIKIPCLLQKPAFFKKPGKNEFINE